jgi:O-antigen/teichoic acid export membrane protein
MNIKDNINKISWSILDKGLFIIFGFITLFQIKNLKPEEFGVFSLVWALNNWLLMINDSFSLQGLVQFGADYKLRPKVNFISLVLNLFMMFLIPSVLFLFAFLYRDNLSPNLYVSFIYLPLFTLTTIPRSTVLKILTREFRYKDIFFVNLVYFGSMTILTFYYIFIYKDLNFELMLMIFISGGVLSSIFSIILARKSLKIKYDKNENRDFTFKKYITFSIPMTLISAFQTIPRSMDIFFIELTMNPINSAYYIGIYNSAKTLFRVIEESTSAAYGLLYPVAVKYINLKDDVSLKKVFTKAISNLLLVYVVIVIVSLLGASEFLIKLVLPEKYYEAINIFNMLIFASLPMPFILLLLALTADNKPMQVLYCVIFAGVFAVITFILAGYSNNINLMPLGIIVYNLILGILGYWTFKKKYNINIKDLLISLIDIKNFVKNYIISNRK